MTNFNPPSLYHSPPDHLSSRGHSRDSDSAGLLSPMPDLTETVNALTDIHTPNPHFTYDQPWPTSSYYGYNQPPVHNAPPHDGLVDIKPYIDRNQMAGLSSEFKAAEGYQQGYNQPLNSANPFANMSTSMLQSYLAGGYPVSYPDPTPNAQNLSNVDVSTSHPAHASVPTEALFHQHMQDAAIIPDTIPERSPSPLLELEEGEDEDEDHLGALSPSSSDSGEPSRPRRRASHGGEPIRTTKGYPRRMSANLPIEEKLLRAQATEGLSKHDKRRVQNKLAQRAFRARSKVANRNAFGRLEHLEELTEQQADRIVKMTELIGRLQKENTGLKTIKFQEAMSVSGA